MSKFQIGDTAVIVGGTEHDWESIHMTYATGRALTGAEVSINSEMDSNFHDTYYVKGKWPRDAGEEFSFWISEHLLEKKGNTNMHSKVVKFGEVEEKTEIPTDLDAYKTHVKAVVLKYAIQEDLCDEIVGFFEEIGIDYNEDGDYTVKLKNVSYSYLSEVLRKVVDNDVEFEIQKEESK